MKDGRRGGQITKERNLIPEKKKNTDRGLNQHCGYTLICQKIKQTSVDGKEGCKQEESSSNLASEAAAQTPSWKNKEQLRTALFCKRIPVISSQKGSFPSAFGVSHLF